MKFLIALIALISKQVLGSKSQSWVIGSFINYLGQLGTRLIRLIWPTGALG